jgi:hypothetical protein
MQIFSKGIIIGACALAICGFCLSPVLSQHFPTVFGSHDEHEPKKIDLKIDSQCHYYQYDPQNTKAITKGDLTGYIDVGCFFNGHSFGNWNETDLGKMNKFFNFDDVKPGDQGEDTISLHTTGDDGCGQIIFSDIKDTGNTCTEPETHSNDADCKNKKPGTIEKNGELREAMQFSLWLDQGNIPGFQGKDKDPQEGDNIFNGKDIRIFDWKNINQCSTTQELRQNLRQARKLSFDDCKNTDPDGDGKNTKNGICAGLTSDGRLIAGTIYYYGLAWRLPKETGNEAQTDGLGFSLSFNVKNNGECSSPCQVTSRNCEERCKD